MGSVMISFVGREDFWVLDLFNRNRWLKTYQKCVVTTPLSIDYPLDYTPTHLCHFSYYAVQDPLFLISL